MSSTRCNIRGQKFGRKELLPSGHIEAPGTTPPAAVDHDSREPLELVCSEVRGGNRPVNTVVDLPGVHGKVYSRPCAGGRGGDIHYLSVCDSGLVCQMLLADVVGHGEAVAAVSGEIHSLLRRYLNRLDQRVVLKKLNRRLQDLGFKALTTAAAINYFPSWRRLSVSYAGHPEAWMYQAKHDRWVPITTASDRLRTKYVDLPLAIDARTVFTRRTLKISHGDRLVVLTDGVLEAPDREGEHLGTARLRAVLDTTRRDTPARIVDAILEALQEHSGATAMSHDDVTILAVEFVPGPRGPVLWHAVKNRLRHQRWLSRRAV